MKTSDVILINQFAQGIVPESIVIERFDKSSLMERQTLLNGTEIMMSQAKPVMEDIDIAIGESGLKKSFTACVMMRKGLVHHNLVRMYDLPEIELRRFFILMLFVFRIAYNRRLNIEPDSNIRKWWYWDLSKEENVQNILRMYPE